MGLGYVYVWIRVDTKRPDLVPTKETCSSIDTTTVAACTAIPPAIKSSLSFITELLVLLISYD